MSLKYVKVPEPFAPLFESAEEVVSEYFESMNKNPEQPALVSWKSDIQAWRSLAAEKDADGKLDAYVSDRLKTGVGRNEESLFVVYLMDSMTQHRKLSGATILPADKAATYLRLARVYEGLNFTPLEDLPEIYRKA